MDPHRPPVRAMPSNYTPFRVKSGEEFNWRWLLPLNMPTKVQQDYEEDLTQEVPAIVTLPSLVNTDKSKAM